MDTVLASELPAIDIDHIAASHAVRQEIPDGLPARLDASRFLPGAGRQSAQPVRHQLRGRFFCLSQS